MDVVIKNEELEVVVSSFGAELSSIVDVKSGKEYIWQKDPKFWAKSSPILFPFVGILKDGKYIYNGKEYFLDTRHGFARDYEFEVANKTEDSVEFLFASNEETKKVYPFSFKLYLKYTLKGKKLDMEYRVENLEDDKMYFSLGAHPAFAIPLNGGSYSDYYLEFENEEDTEVALINGALVDSVNTSHFTGKKLVIERETFKNDAVILENPKSTKVYLKNDKTGYNVGFDYEGFKYMAFWNVVGSEFVCLEPWNGITDYENASGKLEEKVGIEVLDGKSTYVRNLKIEIL